MPRIMNYTNKKSSQIGYWAALRNITRTFILLLIPYFIITKLSYPIELFPKPIYIVCFLALISLFSAESGVTLNKVEVKFDTIKKFFSVRARAVPTVALFLLYFVESLNHKSLLSGLMLSVLSLIVAYLPLKDDDERQIIAIAYFSTTAFLFLSFV